MTSHDGAGGARPGAHPEEPGAPVIDWDHLVGVARAMTRWAYAPYSGFAVGAAGLASDGRVVLGCNVENASFGLTLCAECGMVSDLVAGGGGRLLAVACVDANGAPCMPCGRCRQVLAEHADPDMLVHATPEPLTLGELLPHAFGPERMNQPEGTP